MLRLLQILSFFILAGAVVLSGYMLKTGIPENDRVVKFLESASVADRYRNLSNSSQGKSSDSALVNAAKKYADDGIKPQDTPAPVARTPIARSTPVVAPKSPEPKKEVVAPPAPINVKFKLLGTCVNIGNPSLSMAYIDQPGTGTKWVYQGEKIGHLTLNEVKSELIVLDDKGNLSELDIKMEKSTLVNILKEKEDIAEVKPEVLADVVEPATNKPSPKPIATKTTPAVAAVPMTLPPTKTEKSIQPPKVMTPEENQKLMNELMATIAKMNEQAASADPNLLKAIDSMTEMHENINKQVEKAK